MTDALFAPATSAGEVVLPAPRRAWRAMPLFWRLLGVNLVVVLGGAIVGTWMTQRLVLTGAFTPMSHALLVLAAVCLSAGLSMLLLRDAYAATIREKTDQAERLAAQVIMAQEEERK